MPCVQPNLLKNGRRLFSGTPWVNPFSDAWLTLIAGPSPANTSRPRLPTYPASIDIDERQLMLDHDVERVDGRRTLLLGQRAREDAVGQREAT